MSPWCAATVVRSSAGAAERHSRNLTNWGLAETPPVVVIDVPAAFRHRPYVKYASDGRGTVHLAYTEGHPRDFANSLYHVFYRGGTLHHSDGSVVRRLDSVLSP